MKSCNPPPLNLATVRGFDSPLPLPQDCLDIVVTPTVNGRVFKTRYSRPARDRSCCSTPTGEAVPHYDFVNQPPTVIAGTYNPVIIPNGDQDFVVFAPVVTDDGLPNGTVGLLWSMVSGPGAVVFDDVTRGDTAAHFSVAGTYVLKLTANDGDKEASGTTTITVIHNDPPVVFAGADATVDIDDTGFGVFVSPDATFSDDGVPGPTTCTWSVISGPGTVTLDDLHNVQTAMSFDTPGTYVLELDATDGMLSATPSQVTLTVLPFADLSFQINTNLSAFISDWNSTSSVPTGGTQPHFNLWFITGSNTRHLVATRTNANFTPGDVVDFGAEILADSVVQAAATPWKFLVSLSSNSNPGSVPTTDERAFLLTFQGSHSGAVISTVPSVDPNSDGYLHPDFPINNISPATVNNWAVGTPAQSMITLADYTHASFEVTMQYPVPPDF